MTFTAKFRKTVAKGALAELSAIYCAARDKSGLGGSRWHEGKIYNESGDQIAYISYNGRIWSGTDPRSWTPESKLIYDNRIEA